MTTEPKAGDYQVTLNKESAAKGGLSRAMNLTEDERKSIAKAGGSASWAKRAGIDLTKLPRATHTGELKFGDAVIPCAVLKDGRRILSQRGVGLSLGKLSSGNDWKDGKLDVEGGQLPYFLSPDRLRPFINERLLEKVKVPIYCIDSKGIVIHGVEASTLPLICKAWIDARQAGVLLPQQLKTATMAETILFAFAEVGINALVDEATGYQEDREKNALQKILEKYVAPELLQWTKRFPDEFYKQLFRLRGWGYSPMSVKRPGYVGKLTNKLVYEKLPPGVLEELREKNPTVAPARRKFCHHQFLTEDVGNKHLHEHLLQVVALMKAARSWNDFERMFEIVFPGVAGELKDEALDAIGTECAKEA